VTDATHLLHIELIRLLIVACGMLSHSSSMAVIIMALVKMIRHLSATANCFTLSRFREDPDAERVEVTKVYY
jgi:hypothetical protein